jgi:transcriptional regulator with GAF, ATPase, and Fis domain
MITLEVLTGDNAGTVYQRDKPVVTIGRGPENDLILSDYHLSSQHGQIFREDDRYIYRDLRSTNGSRIMRGSEEIVLDGGEAPLADGDQVQLGSPNEPVVLVCRVRIEESERTAHQEVIARRDLSELPEVQGKLERDPLNAIKLYQVAKKLSRRGLELNAVFDGLAEAVFELVPRVTHLILSLTDEPDGRLHTVFARARAGTERPEVSRDAVRRALKERAAFLSADAKGEIRSDSVMRADIHSVIVAPLWDGDSIRGVLQCDNRANVMLRNDDLDLVTAIAGLATLGIENARLVQRLKLAEEKLRGEVKYLKGREEKRRFSDIIGESSAMREIFRQLEKVIDTRATVSIEGETGTGKEIIASAIHYQGKRRDKLFVAQNCAALPETLLESELFGHKKGAFTGADHDKKGLFEIADQGTLFLDEISEMPISLQAKLLRVLQEGEIRPVGAVQSKQIDVRILCASNKPLEKEVEKGTFRQDLFYRLRVFPLRLPPLRERREDIPLLVDHFLRKYTAEMSKPVAGITPESIDQLQSYNWPGNIRELENEIQRLVIQCDPEDFITPELLAPAVRKVEGLLGRAAPQRKKAGTLKDQMEEVERWLLTEALREHGGNKTKTAEALGITREGLHKKLSKYGM